MDITYKFIVKRGTDGRVREVREYVDGLLHARYNYGYGEPASGSVVIYPYRGGRERFHLEVAYTKKRVSLIRDKVEKIFVD